MAAVMENDTAVLEGLQTLLADANVFIRKAKHYHWNVKGRDFFTLHPEFQKLYEAWTATADGVAERVVALGGRALATMAEDLKNAHLKEDAAFPGAEAM